MVLVRRAHQGVVLLLQGSWALYTLVNVSRFSSGQQASHLLRLLLLWLLLLLLSPSGVDQAQQQHWAVGDALQADLGPCW